MSDPVVNLIVLVPTNDDDAWTVYSPQITGFSGGRESMTDLQRDLPGMLRFAGVDTSAKFQVHTEKVFETEAGEYVIRAANDDRGESRTHTAQRLQAALTVPEQRVNLLV